MATLSIPHRIRPGNAVPANRQDRNEQDIALPSGSKQEESALNNRTTPKKRNIYYPTGDGKPMAEDKQHRKLMAYCCDALEYHFASRSDAYVSGNDFVYYEERNPKARVSPDCYVALGVQPKDERHSYKIWEENGISPAVVFEFTSKKTKKEDLTLKKPLYEQVLRVEEYFQFDPSGDYLKPRLQGQPLINGVYQSIELHDNRMSSEQLALELVIEGETLRFYDPLRQRWLRTYEEAETEAQRADVAEAELNRLRQELETLRQQK